VGVVIGIGVDRFILYKRGINNGDQYTYALRMVHKENNMTYIFGEYLIERFLILIHVYL